MKDQVKVGGLKSLWWEKNQGFHHLGELTETICFCIYAQVWLTRPEITVSEEDSLTN